MRVLADVQQARKLMAPFSQAKSMPDLFDKVMLCHAATAHRLLVGACLRRLCHVHNMCSNSTATIVLLTLTTLCADSWSEAASPQHMGNESARSAICLLQNSCIAHSADSDVVLQHYRPKLGEYNNTA